MSNVDSNDPFATNSTTSSGGTNIGDTGGELLLIWPREHNTEVKTKDYGVKDAIRADWIVLTGADAGEIEEDALIFGGHLIGKLRVLAKKNYKVNGDEGDADRHLLRPFLGRVVQGKEKIRGNYPWLFADPSDADKALAIQWLNDNKPKDENPFG